MQEKPSLQLNFQVLLNKASGYFDQGTDDI